MADIRVELFVKKNLSGGRARSFRLCVGFERADLFVLCNRD